MCDFLCFGMLKPMILYSKILHIRGWLDDQPYVFCIDFESVNHYFSLSIYFRFFVQVTYISFAKVDKCLSHHFLKLVSIHNFQFLGTFFELFAWNVIKGFFIPIQFSELLAFIILFYINIGWVP
jgi:hypothetical protein